MSDPTQIEMAAANRARPDSVVGRAGASGRSVRELAAEVLRRLDELPADERRQFAASVAKLVG